MRRLNILEYDAPKIHYRRKFLMNLFKTVLLSFSATVLGLSQVFAASEKIDSDQTKAKPDSSTAQVCALQTKLYDVFDSNKNSIVKLYSQRDVLVPDKNGGVFNRPTLDVGSGFITGVDGTVVTSAYVTYAAKKIWVEWNGRLMDAECVGFDPLTTLAVVKVVGGFKTKNVPAVFLDPNAPPPPPATMLMSLAYEMGLPPAPRTGLVTAHNIEFGGLFLPTVYIRTNIPAPSGSTGGAIFDMNGKFVGMIIASLPEIGGSFVLPAKAAARIKDDIILCGEPIYSWFGLRAEDRANENQNRVVVTMVLENAPARKAGFKEGDVILEINSQKVSNNTQLRNMTFFVRPGETAKFKIVREDKILTLEILAEKMDSEILKAAEANLFPIKPAQNISVKNANKLAAPKTKAENK